MTKEELITNYGKGAESYYKKAYDYISKLGIENINKNSLNDFLSENKNIQSYSTIKTVNQAFIRTYKILCRENKITPVAIKLIEEHEVMIINREILMEKILCDFQLNELKRYFLIDFRGREYNYRDKLIFELAEYSLSREDIRTIKISDIDRSNPEKYIINNLIERNYPLIIENKDVIFDVDKTIQDRYYIAELANGEMKKYELNDTDYLIRGAVNRITKDGRVVNPHRLMQGTLKKISGNLFFKYINLEKLTLENIKTSKIVSLILEKNIPLDVLNEIYFKGRSEGINNYRKIAKIVQEERELHPELYFNVNINK